MSRYGLILKIVAIATQARSASLEMATAVPHMQPWMGISYNFIALYMILNEQ
jgi:hypothetical protein